MKVIGIVTLVVSVSVILSCGTGKDNAESETNSSNITVPSQNIDTANKTEAITVTDGNKNTITPEMNVSSIALNPAHGLPGHRCDIGVGQPLSSKPATQPSTFINPVTTATTPKTKPTTTYTAPFINPDVKAVTNPVTNFRPTTQSSAGLNPAHGQPGHRCDINVGQPLNSKPAQTSSTTPTTTTLPTITSPTITPTTNTITVAPGMNPAHGQPGHRCDIKVGQPLNSKPAQTTPITP